MITGEKIVFLSEMDWDDLWTRKQQFAKMFGKQNNSVLYVEPHESLPFLIRNHNGRKILRSFCMPQQVFNNVWRISPWPGLPFDGTSDFINRLNNLLLRFQLFLAFVLLGIRSPLLFVYMPQNHPLVGKLGETMSIYDIVDERIEYPGRHKATLAQREKKLLAKVDLATAVTKNLVEIKSENHSSVHLVPNAADLPLFAKAQAKETKIPEELSDLPKPRLGFVGGIHNWVDFELLHKLSRNYPSGSIALIGPRGNDIDLLSDCPNVYWIDKQEQKHLPDFLKGIDCCLIPYKAERLKQYSDPLKVYEYLAAGKPVVAMDMPALSDFESVITIAKTHEEFLQGIEDELQTDSPVNIEKRIDFVKGHGWDSRFNQINELCEKYLSSKG